jgi:methylmalonyl-CoA mutase N-terminal domain/subunit
MLRATTQTLASVVGGADFITTAAWDRPLGESTGTARRLARNTQLILGLESHLGRVLDPAGGAHYVEELSDQLARSGWLAMQEIERAGGAAKVLTSGWLAERLTQRRADRRSAFVDGSLTITGVTDFAVEDDRAPERAIADPSRSAERAARRLRAYRGERQISGDPGAVAEPPGADGWTQPAAEGATLGEISAALGRAGGESVSPLPRYRDSEDHE